MEVIRRISAGDECAFVELYHKYSTPLYTYLLQMVIDEKAAEDLIQDVFLAAWKGAARFRGDASLKTWLYQIAHHQAVSWLRKHVSNGKHDSDIQAFEQELSPEDHMQSRWFEEQVNIALRRLSPDHRGVIELTFFHGMSYQEIAEIMRCPVGTVKSRMVYARRTLEATLKILGVDLEWFEAQAK